MNETPSSRDESEGERLDRNLGELLQELRVALPGVQVLFGFLLAVPFQQGFADAADEPAKRADINTRHTSPCGRGYRTRHQPVTSRG